MYFEVLNLIYKGYNIREKLVINEKRIFKNFDFIEFGIGLYNLFIY